MMISRREVKSLAKDQLKGNWVIAIILFLIYLVLMCSSLSRLLLGGLVSVGICTFTMNLAKNKKARINDLFSNFNIYLKTLGLYLLMLLIVGIGYILFIIPGIILTLMLSQSLYILNDDNEKTITQCIKESANLMKGHKWEFFVLQLSFIGWGLLVVLTFGIAALWVQPYMWVTNANYYIKLKEAK